MKAIERHLYFRNGYYYFRKSFPRNLHYLLPFKEAWIGLNTQDLKQARVSVAQLNYEITKPLDKLRRALNARLPEQSPDKIIHECVSQIEKVKDDYGYESSSKFNHLKRNGRYRGVLSFLKVVELYLKDCPVDAHSTRVHKESTYRLFKEIVDDLPFKNIERPQAQLFKSKLLLMPANAKRAWKVDSFENIDWNKVKTDKPQHPRTINNRLSYMGALFNWAITSGYYHGQNPFQGLFIPKTQKVTSSRTHPFKTEELQVLFEKGLNQGQKYPSMYWVPLIGLYSGMRLNEICQLYVEDIRQEEGVYIFDVNDDGDDKGLKNASSRRKIPIHKELIKQGFLDYVQQQGGKRAFPDIPMGKAAKNYSSTFTKRFWRLLKAIEIKREGLCFHSLRHTFIDGMRSAGVEKAITMNLVGHQRSNDIHSGYGYGYSLEILKENIDKLFFV